MSITFVPKTLLRVLDPRGNKKYEVAAAFTGVNKNYFIYRKILALPFCLPENKRMFTFSKEYFLVGNDRTYHCITFACDPGGVPDQFSVTVNLPAQKKRTTHEWREMGFNTRFIKNETGGWDRTSTLIDTAEIQRQNPFYEHLLFNEVSKVLTSIDQKKFPFHSLDGVVTDPFFRSR